MASGSVKFFKSDKGYGFITTDGGDDVFVHVKALRNGGLSTLEEGQRVTFDVEPGQEGKGPRAANVRAE